MFGISGHGAKLEKPEGPTALSLAELPEEDRSRRGETNQKCDQHHQREEQNETHPRTNHIEQTLGRGLRGSHTLRPTTPPHRLQRDRVSPDFSGYRIQLER
jgi:hypothetical protein